MSYQNINITVMPVYFEMTAPKIILPTPAKFDQKRMEDTPKSQEEMCNFSMDPLNCKFIIDLCVLSDEL